MPTESPRQPVASGASVRPLSFGLTGTIVAVLIVVAALLTLASILQLLAFRSWQDWTNDSIDISAVIDNEGFASISSGIAFLVYAIASVLFVVWFYQAYKSAASRGATATRWGAGWTIGSWFIPFANWVIPKLVMNEVDRMSNPESGEPPIETRWEEMPRLLASDLWWITVLLAIALQFVGWGIYASVEYMEDGSYGGGYLIVAASSLSYAVSAGALASVTLTIGERLRR